MILRAWLVHVALFCLSVIAAAGCGSDSNLPHLLSCDVRATQCQADIYASLAPLLSADPEDLPSVRVISPDAFRQELLDGTSSFKPPEEGPENRALELMGFVPESERDVSLEQIDFWVGDVTGYYDSGLITIIDRPYEAGFVQTLLVHEMVHAMQDRDFDLTRLAAATSSDEILARRSVFEGDAEYFESDWFYRVQEMELDRSDWSRFSRQRIEALYELAANDEKSVFEAANSFPYVFGMRFARWALTWRGFLGRDFNFEKPPKTSHDIIVLQEGNSRASLRLEPLEREVVPPAGYELVTSDRLGAWFLFVYLRRLGEEADDERLGGWVESDYFAVSDEGDPVILAAPHLEWRGDRLSVYQEDGNVVVVWHLRLGSDEPLPLSVDLTLDLVNGGVAPRVWSARQTGEREVALIFAENHRTLEAWEKQPIAPAPESPAMQPKRLDAKTGRGPSCIKTGSAR